MRAVIDANYFIDRKVPDSGITRAYTPSSVKRELRDASTYDYFAFLEFAIEVRDPKEAYVNEVREKIAGLHYGLSDPDIDVVALMLELADEMGSEWIGADNMNADEELVCLSNDNGIKSAIRYFGLCNDPDFVDKRYRLRCFSCFEIYDEEIDFCRACGHSTITRVAVVGEGDEERVCLSKHFTYRARRIKNDKGHEMKCGGQREYEQYCSRMKHKRRN